DRRHMATGLGLAARGLGRVWPNPAVGCVLVKDGVVIGRGWTQPGGRPHAETEALRPAGEAARGATAYVTLEPCAHHGRTPPCADALIAAGVSRVVLAARDPDPRTDGAGVRRLQAAGVDVSEGVLEDEARELNAGFVSRLTRGRPLVTLKLATTLDARIATATGESKWITGEAARARAHLLRATHDAVMVGAGTAAADDPELTCRLPGLAGRTPVRIVIGRLSPASKLARSARAAPVWRIAADEDPELAALGVETVAVGDLEAGLRALAARGVTRLLVEGGRTLATSLLAQGLADRLCWFRAPALIGGDGLPAFDPLGVSGMADLRRFRRVSVAPLGDDLLETYALRP